MERIKAVIFDWAGTVIDYGSLAPMGAFVETFAEFGVSISIDEARGPMGMAKRPHIAAIMALPRVSEAWTKRHGHAPTEADIDAIYAASCRKTSPSRRVTRTLFPARRTSSELRSKGQDRLVDRLHREIMAEITASRAVAGFKPDSLVCTGDARLGAPRPSCCTSAPGSLEFGPPGA